MLLAEVNQAWVAAKLLRSLKSELLEKIFRRASSGNWLADIF